MALRVLVPWPYLFEQLSAVPGIEPVLWHINDDPADAPPAQLLITERPAIFEHRSRVARIEGLEHVHLMSIGYEWVLEHLPAGVGLSNSRGTVEDSTAEHALGLVLAALRQIPQAVHRQRQGSWQRTFTSSLLGSNVLVLGAGGVGGAIIERLLPFKPAAVQAVASTARTLGNGVPVHALHALPQLLPHADVVILALPHTPETEGLVDAGFLSALKDGALLVNVGRGKLVDTEALLAELEAGRLAAALDVTDPEPLPAGHRLWEAPNTLITPHTAGDTAQFMAQVQAMAVEQAMAYAAGAPLANLVRPGSAHRIS